MAFKVTVIITRCQLDLMHIHPCNLPPLPCVEDTDTIAEVEVEVEVDPNTANEGESGEVVCPPTQCGKM